jgi:UTP-glucose-1-phosphate uridylyltransferase
MATYNIYGIGAALVDTEVEVSDALNELLKRHGLNAFETDANIFDCGNKQGF